MNIPTSVEKKENLIKRLLIISHPKIGKTELCTKLPGNYILNYDDSLAHFGATGVDINAYAFSEGIGPISATKRIAMALTEEKKANNGVCPYDYITLDTVTDLERICEPYAKKLFQNTPQGSDFTGNLLTDLEYGAGYLKLRDAFNEILRLFWNLPNKALILTGHLRESSVKTRGSTVAAIDIGLTGKLKSIVSQKCDAIGTLYRSTEKDNVNILSFITRNDDLVTGARPAHIANKEFEISEFKNGNLITHWEHVFPDIKSSKSKAK